ncbi:hypothetical protein ACQSSU_15405 [Micromonospora echinospora]
MTLIESDPPAPSASAPLGADSVIITAPVSIADSAVGTPLIATRRLAAEAPPAQVRDCRTFFSWAYAAGAATTLPVTHTLSIRAHRSVRVVLDRIYAQRLPAPTGIPSRPATAEDEHVRLQCATDAKSRWTESEEKYDLESLPIIGVDEPIPNESFYQDYIFDLAAGGEATLTVPVDPVGGVGRYEYVLRGVVLIDGKPQEFEVNDGGRPFRWSEDLGGMGFSPPTYTWTLLPVPKLTRCAEIRQQGTSLGPAQQCTSD